MRSFNEEFIDAKECYEKGDLISAYNKYLVLAKEGHVESQIFLGWMIATGKVFQADPESGSRWFKQAASLGSASGSFYYGRYLTTQNNHIEAFKYYLIASERGSISGTFRVGYSLSRGKGTDVNYKRSYGYLHSASKQGHIFALKEIGVLDIKGQRGFAHRFLGFFEVMYAIFWGMSLSIIDPYSDRLRG